MSKDNATMFFKARNYGVLACCLIALYVVLNVKGYVHSVNSIYCICTFFTVLWLARPENYVILAGLGPSRKFHYPCWAGPVQKIPLPLLGWACPENSFIFAGMCPYRKIPLSWLGQTEKTPLSLQHWARTKVPYPSWVGHGRKNFLILARKFLYPCWAEPTGKFCYPCWTG